MELNFKVFGQGEPVIILHGLFGTLDNWQTIAKALADHYMVYIVDQRNHGRSPHTDGHSYVEMSEDLRAFMESHWIYKAHIIGHSMGGKTAMQFAIDHEDMVQSLTVVDIAPRDYPPRHDHIFQAMLTLDLSVEDRKSAENHMEQFVDEAGERLFLLKNLSRKTMGGYEWKPNLSVIHRDYGRIMERISSDHPIDIPTLFIKGGNSQHIVPAIDTTEILALFPQATITTIEGASHWVHADQPQAILDILRKFLDSEAM